MKFLRYIINHLMTIKFKIDFLTLNFSDARGMNAVIRYHSTLAGMEMPHSHRVSTAVGGTLTRLFFTACSFREGASSKLPLSSFLSLSLIFSDGTNNSPSPFSSFFLLGSLLN